LKPSLDYRGVPSLDEGKAIVRALLEEFAKMLMIIESIADKVKFNKTQGVLQTPQRENELHPTKGGFDALVEIFYQAIKAEFSSRVK
jgi:hypothetical protein